MTATDICNIALRRIGSERLNDLYTDVSHVATVARDIYDEARRDCLNLHNWNFASKRAALTVSTTAPAFGWDYAYPLPDDFIRMISVHPYDDETATVEYRLEFQESDDRVLVTNSNQIFVRYVFDLEDVSAFSAAFRDVLAFRLAREFAAAIPQSSSTAELTDAAFRRKLSHAKSIDGVEDFPDRMADGSWISERDDPSVSSDW